MDVHCSTCGEPWDTFHLWQDAIYDTGLDEDVIEDWLKLPTRDRLAPPYRERFAEAAWEFGASILHVRHCPGCRGKSPPDPDLEAAKSAICEMLGDDEDGIAVTFEDHGL